MNTATSTAVARDSAVRRAARTEHRAGGARAETGTRIRALAALDQHQRNDAAAQLMNCTTVKTICNITNMLHAQCRSASGRCQDGQKFFCL